ncbi:MAG: hypothetical protein ACD_76C00102G0008, partial [uncultured bacterium]
MHLIPIKTRAMIPPKDDLFSVMRGYLPKLKNGDVLVIASKVLAIHQGRCVKIEDQNKDRLIRREADAYIPGLKILGKRTTITIKENTLISSAGIDESNAMGHYILWPEKIQKSAKEIWKWLCKQYKLKQVGVIIADSHTIPLRAGTLGISIGSFGFEPVFDYRGKPDIFGRILKITRANIADALAVSAVHEMGEGLEKIPFVIVRGANNLHFNPSEVRNKIYIEK